MWKRFLKPICFMCLNNTALGIYNLIMPRILIRYLLVSFLLVQNSYAVDLLTMYNQAINHDPIFKEAEANYLASSMNPQIARAALLPQISTTASQTYTNTHASSTSINPSTQNKSTNIAISLNQVIFNMPRLHAAQNANILEKQAYTQYQAAIQSLLYRVTRSYFDLLNSIDNLQTIQVETAALLLRYKQAQEKRKVGLFTITEVYEAKAQYDRTYASEVQAFQSLIDAQESLAQITGVYPKEFTGIKDKLKLGHPTPNNVDEWIKNAKKNNPDVLAAIYNLKSSKRTHLQKISANYPQASLSSSLSYAKSKGLTKTENRIATLGINAGYDVFTGGKNSAEIKQSAQNIAKSQASLLKISRQVTSAVRSSFNGINTNISLILAEQQAIKTTQNALDSSQKSVKAGTATMLNILNSISNLSKAKQALSRARYQYLLNIIQLKQSAGILSIKDLQNINSNLTVFVKLPGMPLSISQENLQ